MLRNDRPGAPISRAVGSAIDVAAFHRPPEDRSDVLALSTALPRGRTAGSASCVCSLLRAHEAFGPPRQIPLSRLRDDCESAVAREVCISTRAGDESPHVTPAETSTLESDACPCIGHEIARSGNIGCDRPMREVFQTAPESGGGGRLKNGVDHAEDPRPAQRHAGAGSAPLKTRRACQAPQRTRPMRTGVPVRNDTSTKPPMPPAASTPSRSADLARQ
jgi:hypothetical protein